MALYISMKKTPHTTSQLHLFQVCFFLLTVSFSELFLLPCHFFPPVCHFNKIHHQKEQFVYVEEALEVLSIQF